MRDNNEVIFDRTNRVAFVSFLFGIAVKYLVSDHYAGLAAASIVAGLGYCFYIDQPVKKDGGHVEKLQNDRVAANMRSAN